MTPAERQRIRDLMLDIGKVPAPARKIKTQIKDALKRAKKSWNDLADIVRPAGSAPAWFIVMSDSERNKPRGMFGKMGVDYIDESDSAERKLRNWLMRAGRTWGDVLWLIQPEDVAASASPHVAYAMDIPSPLVDLIEQINRYVAIDPHECLALALWTMHTYVYDRYVVTPRLLFTSPVNNCGKSTAMDVLRRVAWHPTKRLIAPTAAAIYRKINEGACTLFIDEGENLDTSAKPVLRAVLDLNRQGEVTPRVINNEVVEFNAFAPIAAAAVGASALMFGWGLISRSIVAHMGRHDRSRSLERLPVEGEPAPDLHRIRDYVALWVPRAKLALDPPMPDLDLRVCDNWRPLIAIADACGEDWGKRARAAMVALAGKTEQNILIMLLAHIRVIFDRLAVDRVPSARLLDELITLDISDGTWREYRGPSGTTAPRRLTQATLARLLGRNTFGIEPRTVWPPHRKPGDKGPRGYYRADFEAAWARYCERVPTASAPPSIRLILGDA
jgi:hypothetical protein